MKHMSISEYAQRYVENKGVGARASLFLRSLSLRYWMWKSRRHWERLRSQQRADLLRAQSAKDSRS
jgi:hypothetical protein